MNIADGLRQLAQALGELGLRYAVGGSLASSSRGVPRSTNDVDLVVDIQKQHVDRLAGKLGKSWYIDPDHARDSISRGRSFNVVCIPISHKFDIFPATTPFHLRQLERSTNVAIPLDGERVTCPVASSEDIVLAKLVWLRQLGGHSERQENDIAGVIAVNAGLDWTYMDEWAGTLGVTDLLAKFRQ